MTTLELTTLAYILCAIGLIFFWRHKPMDVSHPFVVDCPTPLALIRDSRGRSAATEEYTNTPLDFIEREEWIVTKLCAYYANLLRRMGVVHTFPAVKPVRHVHSFYTPAVNVWSLVFILVATTGYVAIFLAAWNFHFPSQTEQTLWRIATLSTFFITFFGGLFEILSMLWRLWRRASFVTPHRRNTVDIELDRKSSSLAAKLPPRAQKWLQRWRNNTPDQDPIMDIPIRSLMITTPLGVLYGICRLIILALDFSTLRELPVTAFMAIDWSMYVPHL